MKSTSKIIFNFFILSIGILFILIQSSCKANKNTSRIVVAGAGKIISLDPAQANTFHALQLISALGDPLYRLNREGKLIPKLASEEPRVSKDRLSIKVPLRKGVIFHDGYSFNAESMVFSFNRFMEIGTMNYIFDDHISSIEAINEYLIKINLKRPSASIEGLLTSINLTPVSPGSYSKYKTKFLNKSFVGTGPYKLKSFNSHQQKLEPFKGYWGLQPKNDGIDFISLSNSTSLFVALQSKEIDVLLSNSLDEDQKRYLNQEIIKGNLKEGKGPALEIGFISLNTSSKLLKDPLLRRALSFSLDRNLISQRVSYGSRKPLRSLVPPILMRNGGTTLWPSYNPSKAKQLLTKAGYCINRKAIIPLTFRSNVPADKLFALTWKEQVQRDFPNCLRLKLNGMESTTIYRQLKTGTFDAVVLDWRGAYPGPEAYLSPLLSCKKIIGSYCEEGESAESGSFWGSKLVQKALKEIDQLKGLPRLKKINEVEFYTAKGNPYLPIWIVSPKAWGQRNISAPQFDGNGQLLLHRLKQLK